jgi:hypothetical protein
MTYQVKKTGFNIRLSSACNLRRYIAVLLFLWATSRPGVISVGLCRL